MGLSILPKAEQDVIDTLTKELDRVRNVYRMGWCTLFRCDSDYPELENDSDLKRYTTIRENFPIQYKGYLVINGHVRALQICGDPTTYKNKKFQGIFTLPDNLDNLSELRILSVK